MIIRDNGGGGDVSSASPSALMAYSTTGQGIDGDLETESVKLGAALIEFEASCQEYSTGVTTVMADALQALARQTSQTDVWVGRVARAFAKADGGGLASALALDPNAVSNWSTLDKLKYALQIAMSNLPADVAQRLEAMLSPGNLAALAAVVAIWAGAQFFGVGEVADVVVAVVGFFALGTDAITVGKDLGEFAVGVMNAHNADDLNNAGQKFADAVAIGGIDSVLALLFHKASESMPERDPVMGSTDLVTPDGIVVTVPTASIPKDPVLTMSEVPISPNNVVSDAVEQEILTEDPALANDPAALMKNVDAEVQQWVDGLPSRPTPTSGPANQFEIKYTGPNNITAFGGGSKFNMDGVGGGNQILEAKFINKPGQSPYIPDSNIDPEFRPVITAKTESEFQRMAAIVNDPNTPVTGVIVITNDARAVGYFEQLMLKYGIIGKVVVAPQ
ncbi:MAG: hypothetical protein JO020_31470 [Chloroflexi bacterium]|nr:hypothetical protein [Chloroflexota bacterium]MBV9898697.1 hypothetical protein [Chloroflexota bacterium]